MTLSYFAYGSNMSLPRLRRRVASARSHATAVLHGHRLCFHKVGRDGSAKCDAALSSHPDDIVHGVLYHLDPSHKARLDEVEGLGRGYQQKAVVVGLPDGNETTAFTYYATHIDAALQPYSWYLEHVIRGAREHGLPNHYRAMLIATGAIPDPDRSRHRMELSIYTDRVRIDAARD